MKIAAFPKCYMDDISIHRTMDLFEWIDMARLLDADGLEMYDGFFTSLDDAYIDRVTDTIHQAGFEIPMLCCSPDFTNPDPNERQKAVDREAFLIRITRRMGGPGSACRVLSGQRYPEVPVDQGVEWVVEAINQLLPVAREYDVVLAMENHYIDSHWQYPEFAQKKDVFLRIVNAITDREYFGVQYDPSNALVAGDDPIELLREVVDRVVTMHASDRYLVEGARLEDLRQADGTLKCGFSLRHGVTGKGLNDFDLIFSILSGAGFQGWISIEDGMNGMAEMQQSIEFLKQKRAEYF